MSRQCPNPKCIGNKNKSLTSHKYKNKEKALRPPSTSRRSSSDNSTASRNKRTPKHKKPKSKRSKDGSKNSRTSFNIESRKCKKYVGRSALFTREFLAERRSSANSHGHANLRSTSEKRNKRQRKRSRRRHKKASKRESARPRNNNCFARLCVCMRDRSSDELRVCKCTSSHGTPSHRECYSVKDGQEGTKRVTRRSTLKNDTQVGKNTAGPSNSERKLAFKRSHKLSLAKPKLAHFLYKFVFLTKRLRFVNDFNFFIIKICSEERSMITRGLNTVRRGIDRFSVYVISLVTK
ncbi:uncharacterized protein LOC114255530 [Monomorium pharaonis]|uniref:uncharacterized protein LOC114255530 n=1 Tax=Monomorium pharaonis TaxID=307658 RepID=UPI001746364D|nr:uncharacterized protein LOC114255530 [Monomorium pharaonis]